MYMYILIFQCLCIDSYIIFYYSLFIHSVNEAQQFQMKSNVMKDVSNAEETISKLSRSKSKKHVQINKLREKEQRWNDRFHLQQIPEYNYQNEPYLQGLKNKFKFARKQEKINQKVDFTSGKPRKNKDMSLQKNRVTNKPNPLRNQEKHKEAIRKAFQDLKKLWYDKNIPEQHMEAMTKILSNENNPMKILEDIKTEFSQIEKDNSFIQKTMTSIGIREGCLNKIKELLENVRSQIKLQNRKIEFEEKIHHLRLLTIHSVECVFQWKQYIESLFFGKPTKIDLKYNSISYFQKIKDDSFLFKNSRFSEIYRFSDKTDPFLLNITYKNKKVANISKNLMKRIRLCENIIDEVPSSTPNITETDQELKVDRSLNNLPITISKQKLIKINVQYSQFTQYFNNLIANGSFEKSIAGVIDTTKFQEFTILSHEKAGQIIIAVDKNSSQRKISILGVSTKIQNLQELIKCLAQFLWQNDQCSQIRIGLLHIANQKGVFSVNIDIQKLLKGLGFRWICVNNSDNIRITIYALKRPLNNRQLVNTQFYPVIMQHITSLSSQNKNKKKIPTSCCLAILSILKLINETDDKLLQKQIETNEQFQPYLQKLNAIKSYVYSGLKPFELKSNDNLQKILVNLTMKPEIKIPNFVALLNLSFKFKNFYMVDEKHLKFFPNKDIEIIICESIYPIYLLQTDQENITFFIFQVESNFVTSQIQSVFNAMGEQSSFIDEFWVPIFKKESKYIDDVGFNNEMMVSTDYRTKLQSINRKSKPRTKIIKPPFVFGLINKELVQMIQIPFFSTLITKDDLI